MQTDVPSWLFNQTDQTDQTDRTDRTKLTFYLHGIRFFFTCEICNNWKTTELPPIHIEQNQKYNDKRIADHTKGDFIDLVKKDMEELDIEFIDGKPLKPLKCN